MQKKQNTESACIDTHEVFYELYLPNINVTEHDSLSNSSCSTLTIKVTSGKKLSVQRTRVQTKTFSFYAWKC